MRRLQMTVMLCVITFVQFPGSAKADFLSGNQLHDLCQKKATPILNGFVIGAVALFEQSFLLTSKLEEIMKTNGEKLPAPLPSELVRNNICQPERVTVTQYVDILCKYVSDHPADRHKPSGTMFSDAMEDAWPCQK